jgi:hypothetical protein
LDKLAHELIAEILSIVEQLAHKATDKKTKLLQTREKK